MITPKIRSLFTFGIFLLTAGIILSILEYPKANLIMAVGLVFELMAILLFVYRKLKNNQ